MRYYTYNTEHGIFETVDKRPMFLDPINAEYEDLPDVGWTYLCDAQSHVAEMLREMATDFRKRAFFVEEWVACAGCDIPIVGSEVFCSADNQDGYCEICIKDLS